MKEIIRYWAFFLALMTLFVLSILIPIILPIWAVVLAGYLMLTLGRPLFKKPNVADYVLSPIFIVAGLVTTLGLIANAFLQLGFFKLLFLAIVTAIASQIGFIIFALTGGRLPKKRIKKNIGGMDIERVIDYGDLIAGLIIILLSWLIIGGVNGVIVGTVLSLIVAVLPFRKTLIVRAVLLIIIIYLIRYSAGFLGGFFG